MWYTLFNPEEQIMTCYSAEEPEKYIKQICTECYPGSKSKRMKTVQFQMLLEHGGIEKFYVVISNEKPVECKWVCRWFWYGDMPLTIKWTLNHLDWHLVSKHSNKNSNSMMN